MTNILHQKRAARIRRKLKKINSERFRLTVFRSSRNISEQIILTINKCFLKNSCKKTLRIRIEMK